MDKYSQLGKIERTVIQTLLDQLEIISAHIRGGNPDLQFLQPHLAIVIDYLDCGELLPRRMVANHEVMNTGDKDGVARLVAKYLNGYKGPERRKEQMPYNGPDRRVAA